MARLAKRAAAERSKRRRAEREQLTESLMRRLGFGSRGASTEERTVKAIETLAPSRWG